MASRQSWSEIQIGKNKVLVTPLRPESKEYPDCTADGQVLKKTMIGKGHAEYSTPDGKPYDGERLKLVNGKPMGKLKRTTSVPKPDKMPLKEVEDYDSEESLFCQADEAFVEELRKAAIALTFPFTFGNGLKIYKGILFPKGNSLVLRLSRVNLAKRIADIEAGIKAGKSLEDLQAELEASEKENENELLKELNI